MAERPEFLTGRPPPSSHGRRRDPPMRSLTAKVTQDALGGLLHAVRFRGAVMCKSALRAPWGFAVEGREFASFHHVVRGSGWLEVEGVAGLLRLERGDLVVLPQGNAHVVRDAPSSPATKLEQLVATGEMDALGNLKAGGRGKETVLVCGGFHFDGPRSNPVLAALPPVLHLRSDRRGAAWLRMALAFLARESCSVRPGSATLVSRLADIVFIEAVRSYFASPAAERDGLVAALGDPRIGAALTAIHRRPEAAWDLSSLAKSAGMSRTAFSLRFRTLLGEPPLQYVTARRMEKAQAMLRDGTATIAQIAESVGYDSEVGFHRAFKRHTKIAPAAFRRRARSLDSRA
jgi:AraC-like DNA-binding protein